MVDHLARETRRVAHSGENRARDGGALVASHHPLRDERELEEEEIRKQTKLRTCPQRLDDAQVRGPRREATRSKERELMAPRELRFWEAMQQRKQLAVARDVRIKGDRAGLDPLGPHDFVLQGRARTTR